MREHKITALMAAGKLINSSLDLSDCPALGQFRLASSRCVTCTQLAPCSWRGQTKSSPQDQSDAELDRNLALAQMRLQNAVDTSALSPESLLEAQDWLVSYSGLFLSR